MALLAFTVIKFLAWKACRCPTPRRAPRSASPEVSQRGRRSLAALPRRGPPGRWDDCAGLLPQAHTDRTGDIPRIKRSRRPRRRAAEGALPRRAPNPRRLYRFPDGATSSMTTHPQSSRPNNLHKLAQNAQRIVRPRARFLANLSSRTPATLSSGPADRRAVATQAHSRPRTRRRPPPNRRPPSRRNDLCTCTPGRTAMSAARGKGLLCIYHLAGRDEQA